MATHYSPKIVTDGLVFYYDKANSKKSWKGAPTTNLYTDGDYALTTLHPVRNGPWTFPAGVTDPNGNQVIRVDQDGTTSYHGRDITVTNATVYTSSCWIFVSSDSNTTLVQLKGEQGFGSSGQYNLTNKGTWQLVSATATTTTTNARILAYQLSNMTTGYVLFGSVQFEQSVYYTPFVEGTRLNTEAIVDMGKNNETITATSLTYTQDDFSFDGTSDSLSINSGIALSSNYVTVTAWVKVDSHGDWHDFVKNNWVNNGWLLFASSTTWVFGVGVTASQYTSTIAHSSSTDWTHLTGVYNGTNVQLYVNGVAGTPLALGSATLDTGNTVVVGRNTAPSAYDISVVQIYDRALTEDQVKNNFEASRGRFGI